MTDWQKLCASFTKEETDLIDLISKKSGFTRSQIIRASVATGIQSVILQLILNNPDSGMASLEMPLSKIFDKKFMKNVEKLRKDFQKNQKELISKIEQEMNLIQETSKPFTSHKKRGAPKKKTRKRGRVAEKEKEYGH